MDTLNTLMNLSVAAAITFVGFIIAPKTSEAANDLFFETPTSAIFAIAVLVVGGVWLGLEKLRS